MAGQPEAGDVGRGVHPAHFLHRIAADGVGSITVRGGGTVRPQNIALFDIDKINPSPVKWSGSITASKPSIPVKKNVSSLARRSLVEFTFDKSAQNCATGRHAEIPSDGFGFGSTASKMK